LHPSSDFRQVQDAEFPWAARADRGRLAGAGIPSLCEDAEIYLPGVEKILHPELFPVGREFFLSHASMTFFPNVVAFSLRVTHLPMEAGLFICMWRLFFFFCSPVGRCPEYFFRVRERGGAVYA